MIYFLSDLHLGAGYRKDARAHEQRVVRWLDTIAGDAEALYLMGDILDYWYEYRTVVPRGYVRFFGALARLADAGVRIVWFTGNHDIWLFDYLRDEIGLEVVTGSRIETILGRRFFLDHGDGVGRRDVGFRVIRWIFHNKVCQRLYSAIHPRWTVGFAHRWSAHSRKAGGYAPSVAPLVEFAEGYLREVDAGIDYFVFGHLHVVEDRKVGEHSRLIVLGDWISHYTYGTFDGERFEVRKLQKDSE